MLWSALVLGFIGSLHCVGMCGPLVMAIPAHFSKMKFISGRIAYHLGRISAYAILGILIGLIGKGFDLVGIQRWVSIIIGLLMILSLLLPKIKIQGFSTIYYLNSLKGFFAKVFQDQRLSKMYTAGIANGLLPCGLVYAALAGALAIGYSEKSAFYMILFGLGTLPAMVFVSLGGTLFPLSWRGKLNRLAPYFVAFIGLLFVMRGLGLGIPFLSPELGSTMEVANLPTADCHN